MYIFSSNVKGGVETPEETDILKWVDLAFIMERSLEPMAKDKGLVELLRKAGYPEKAIDYYLRKVNVGVIEGANATDTFTGLCGDSMRVYLKVEKGVIRDAKFQAIGCAGAFASGSTITEMAKGKKLEDARKITEQDVLQEIEGLPGPKLHCARLAIDALKKSIDSYRK